MLFPFVIRCQRFLEVVTDADVIHDKALVLVLIADAIYAGDGLEQIVVGNNLVEVQHLLDGRVEAGDQHIVDDNDPDAAIKRLVPFLFLSVEWELEAPDGSLVVTLVGECLDMRLVVVRAGDHHRGLKRAQVDPR